MEEGNIKLNFIDLTFIICKIEQNKASQLPTIFTTNRLCLHMRGIPYIVTSWAHRFLELVGRNQFTHLVHIRTELFDIGCGQRSRAGVRCAKYQVVTLARRGVFHRLQRLADVDVGEEPVD